MHCPVSLEDAQKTSTPNPHESYTLEIQEKHGRFYLRTE